MLRSEQRSNRSDLKTHRPQLLTHHNPLCPSTAMSFRLPLRLLTAYFRLPRTSVPRPLPATPNYKKVVWSFIEDQFDRHTGVRAAKNGGKWTLFWQPLVAR